MAICLDFIAETGSTNADLLARLSLGEDLEEGYWLIADRQNAGRGRQGRKWLDASGNFMGSTLVKCEAGDPPAHMLSFVASLAVYSAACAIVEQAGIVHLKWPNDVLISGAKFSGILLERQGKFAIIGIGSNLATAPDIEGRHTASLEDAGVKVTRDQYAKILSQEFARELAIWRKNRAADVLDRWQAAAHRPGARLSVHTKACSVLSGSFDGLEQDGALRLCLDDGAMRVIHAGDVMLESE